MGYRLNRINQLIKREISQLLLREINFDNSLVTVTNVDTSPDLRNARIKITVIPSDNTEKVLKIIKDNISHLQKEFNRKIHLKATPQLRFEADQQETQAQRIRDILDQISRG